MTAEDAARFPPNVWKAYAFGACFAILAKKSGAYQNAQGLARGWFDDGRNPFDPETVN